MSFLRSHLLIKIVYWPRVQPSLGRLAILHEGSLLSLFSHHWNHRSTLLYVAFCCMRFGVRTQVFVFVCQLLSTEPLPQPQVISSLLVKL